MALAREQVGGGGTVLDLDAAGSYRPATKETRAAYEALLAMVQGQFGDQPADVLRGAAEEVLAVLKNDHMKARPARLPCRLCVHCMHDRFDVTSQAGAAIAERLHIPLAACYLPSSGAVSPQHIIRAGCSTQTGTIECSNHAASRWLILPAAALILHAPQCS